MGPRVFISAGEASGEHYGALLIAAVRQLAPEASFFGLGGTQMGSAGCDRIVRTEDVAHMGITEVIRHMPAIYGKYRKLVRSIRERRPDVAVLIDFPDVNLRLAKHLKRQNIPVIYFVSPQLWAWKKRRIFWVRDRVTRMLVIFPFEEPFYRDKQVDAEFVGHPLADQPMPTVGREEYASKHGLNNDAHWIGLLPGSRQRELELNLPEMLRAAALLGSQFQFLLPVAPTLTRAEVENTVQRYADSRLRVPIEYLPDAREVLFHSRASVVASGTATIQAALIGKPFVVVYRVSPVTYAVATRLIRLPHVAMVNLIAGQRIVPELIQNDFRAENVVRELNPLLESGPARSKMLGALNEVRKQLELRQGDNKTAIQRVAAQVVQLAVNSEDPLSQLAS